MKYGQQDNHQRCKRTMVEHGGKFAGTHYIISWHSQSVCGHQIELLERLSIQVTF